MIISDLQYIETVDNSEVQGASGYYPYYYYPYPKAEAVAGADALAVGKKTFTSTYTNATAVSGVFSSSNSGSYAKASY